MKQKLGKMTGRILSALLALALIMSGLTFSSSDDKTYAASGVVSKKEAQRDDYGREPYFEVTNNHGTNFAFCIDFNAEAPDEGTAVGEPVLSTNHALRRVLYYGNGGPADLGVYGWTFTSMAASSAVGNIPMKDGVSVGDHYTLSLFASQPVPPENFKVYTVSTGIAGQQDLAYWRIEETPKGAIQLYKKSSNESISNNNACYSLEGAVIAVYKHGTSTEVGRFAIDKNGYGGIINNLPVGQYDLKELKAPKGFVLDSETATVTVTANRTITYTFYNQPANDPVGLLLMKIDNEGNTSVGEAGVFAGAQYTFEYYDGQYIEAELVGIEPKRTWVLETNEKGRILLNSANKIAGDDFYKSLTGRNVLPVGTLKIYETLAPVGYEIDPEVYVVNITAEEYTGALIKSYQTVTSSEEVFRGGVEVQKVDSETGSTAQGSATLAGAEFTIYNRNDYNVIVNSTEYAPGEAVLTLVTDDKGHAASAVNALPYGSYEIAETKAPAGYILDSTLRSFSITADGEVISFTGDNAFKNTVIRGGLELQKVDSETGSTAQGKATLEGAEYTIYAVKEDGAAWLEEVMTITTNSKGYAATETDALLYGEYVIRETKAPKGYVLNATETSFSITVDGEVVSFTGDNSLSDQVIRGDLKGIKVSDGDMNRMAGIPFRITSVTTGESHVVITDENGEFNTSSGWNLHSNNTNAGETSSDGVWFGDIDELDDTRGALPYDTYLIEELECEANEYMIIIDPFEITVSKDMVTVDLGTITNDYRPQPTIHTTATNTATGTHIVNAEGEVTLTDTVTIDNLVPGWEYTLESVAMDFVTVKSIMVDGKELSSSMDFTADDTTMEIVVTFTVSDASELKGKKLVFYEYLYRKGELLASHEDINDEGQSIYFPLIHTVANNGNSTVTAAGVVNITDTIIYSNFPEGKYKAVGIAMTEDVNGKPVKFVIDGKEVVAEKIFDVKGDGTVDVTFTFNALEFAGKKVVFYEQVYDMEGNLVAVHEDFKDLKQTVEFVAPEEPPKTGDDILLFIPVIFMAASLVTAAVTIVIKKRKIKN